VSQILSSSAEFRKPEKCWETLLRSALLYIAHQHDLSVAIAVEASIASFSPPRGYHEALRGFETVPWRGRSIVIADNRALFRNLRTLSSIYPSRYVKVRALIASRAADDAPSALNDI